MRLPLAPLVFASLASLASLVGCTAPAGDSAVEEADPCAPGPDPTLALGKGELAFHELDDDGGEAELIYGPQGGYHVTLAFRATQLDASEPWTAHVTGVVDGEELADTRPYLTMRCNPAAGALEFAGVLLIFDAQPEDVHGRTVEVAAEVTDAAGTTLDAAGELLVIDLNLE